MADAPPPPSTPESSPGRNAPPAPGDANQRYWCYSCDRRVMVDREGGEILCRECRNGFVEAIVGEPVVDGYVDVSSFGEQMLRLIDEASREDDGDVVPPAQLLTDDILRIDLDGWHNDDEEEYEEEDGEEFQNGEQFDDGEEEEEWETDEEGNEVNIENDENHRDIEVVGGQEDERRRRREVLRLRIRDIASRAYRGRNMNLDLAEILMGLENNLLELRMQLPETDGYFGNPEDYVDAAGYEALLQNLAESDQSGRRGAPAASKSFVAELPTVVITDSGCEACAICKDGVSVGDSIKKMPCGHGYHGDCIVPWLESRNSCPVCRYELPTDDPEYEEERKRKLDAGANGPSGSGFM